MSKLIFSFGLGVLALGLSIVVFFAILNQTPRRAIARPLVNAYVFLSGKPAPVVETPFTDIAGLAEAPDIARMYGVKLTAGTSASTFSPEAHISPAQTFTFIGKLLAAVYGWG